MKNIEFIKKQTNFLFQLLIIFGLVFGVHNSYLLHYFFTKTFFFFPLWQIYVFHYIITSLLFGLINYKYSKKKTNIFNLFMLGTFLKMTLAILFLLPLLFSDFKNKQPDIFNFFISYFLFLAFEVISISKRLQDKELTS